MTRTESTSRQRLRKTVVCPSCWEKSDTLNLLWISEHQELRSDIRLGDEATRFLPSRFTPDGRAIDLRGFPCSQVACPHCHLQIPRSLLEFAEFPLAILGAPSSGKSFFLGSLSWTLRGTLPNELNLSFDDADASANLLINEYEQSLFMSESRGGKVALGEIINKTLEAGALYRTVHYADTEVRYSVPFSFSMLPNERHPAFDRRTEVGRTVLLYDSAGEHFLPGRGEDSLSITRNMSGCSALLYTFDPTQDVQFRRSLKDTGITIREQQSRSQIPILQEAATRIRRLTGLRQSEKTRKPLIVVLTKCDTWLDRNTLPDRDFMLRKHDGCPGLDFDLVQQVSSKIRERVNAISPQMVNAAESFSERVFYVPVSAVGWNCEVTEETEHASPYEIELQAIEPFWVTLPFLLALHLTSQKLI